MSVMNMQWSSTYTKHSNWLNRFAASSQNGTYQTFILVQEIHVVGYW